MSPLDSGRRPATLRSTSSALLRTHDQRVGHTHNVSVGSDQAHLSNRRERSGRLPVAPGAIIGGVDEREVLPSHDCELFNI